MEKVLLHICCGPCTAGSLPRLLKEKLDVKGFFYNPNIHPVTELKSRMAALDEYAPSKDLPIIWRKDYGLVDFVSSVSGREDDRCEYCYTIRMMETAREAQRQRIGLFTTTLLYSIYQKHNLIRDIAEQAAREAGLDFLYIDLREKWRAGQQLWRETDLYSQKYCGCIYSEMDRYMKKDRKSGKASGCATDIPLPAEKNK